MKVAPYRDGLYTVIETIFPDFNSRSRHWRRKEMHERGLVSAAIGRLTKEESLDNNKSHSSSCPTRQLICYVASAMPEKKRKRSGEGPSERPHKKTVSESVPPKMVKVSFLPEEDEWAPIVGMASRTSTPTSIQPIAFRY